MRETFRRHWPRLRVWLAVLAVLGGGSDVPAEAASKPAHRVFYMAAVEPKGGTTVDKEPFPTSPPPPGNGYIRKPPNAEGRWEVSTYRWDPSVIVVNQGDTVTLEIIGINGDKHPSTIEGYVPSFTVRRGEVTRLTFVADKPGHFLIQCTTHTPSMRGYLIVLPR